MLGKRQCLKRKKDFDKVFKKGKAFKKDFLLARILPSAQEFHRVGIIVSKKVSNKATERNVIKRRIRVAVKELLNNIEAPLDIVIVVQASANKKISLQEIRNVLEELFLKAGIIKSGHIS